MMRRIFIGSSIAVTALLIFWSSYWTNALYGFVIVVPLILLGAFDIVQKKRAIRRNYPLVGRLRYLFESIRPEIQQYFVESDTSGTPINRMDRSVISVQTRNRRAAALPEAVPAAHAALGTRSCRA